MRKRRQVQQVPVEREPVAAALTPDGRLLFVANHIHTGPADAGMVAARVSVIDTSTRTVVRHIDLPSGSTLLRGICVSPDGRFAAVTHVLARFHLPATQVEHGWMSDNALSVLDVGQLQRINTVLLDTVDRGAASSLRWQPSTVRSVALSIPIRTKMAIFRETPIRAERIAMSRVPSVGLLPICRSMQATR